MRESLRYRVFIHVAAIFAAVVILVPFAWMAIASVSSQADLISRPLHWIPQHPSIGRYVSIFTQGGQGIAATFRRAVINSAIVAACADVIAVFVGILGGYAFARLQFRFRRATLVIFLATYMLPPIALLVPLYLIISSLGLLDTKVGLIIVYCSYVTPFVLWTLSNYFLTIPGELEEAARVDGCTRMGALFRIMLPAAKPGIFAAIMFSFLLAWDEFIYALIFTSSDVSKTIPVAIAEFSGKHSTDFGLVAAGGIIAAIPPVLLAIAFQRYVVSGMSAGALKG